MSHSGIAQHRKFSNSSRNLVICQIHVKRFQTIIVFAVCITICFCVDHHIIVVISVPVRLGKGQGAKAIGHNPAREQPKFGHYLVRDQHKLGHSSEHE